MTQTMSLEVGTDKREARKEKRETKFQKQQKGKVIPHHFYFLSFQDSFRKTAKLE